MALFNFHWEMENEYQCFRYGDLGRQNFDTFYHCTSSSCLTLSICHVHCSGSDLPTTYIAHLKCTMRTNELHCYSEFNFRSCRKQVENLHRLRREPESERAREYISTNGWDTRLFAMQMLTIHTIYMECCITLLCTIWTWIATDTDTDTGKPTACTLHTHTLSLSYT